jgi:hypothetical protein
VSSCNTSATVPGQLDGTEECAVTVHIANRLPDGTRVVELRTTPMRRLPSSTVGIGSAIGLPAGATLS